MQDAKIRETIQSMHRELNLLLQEGTSEAYEKIYVKLHLETMSWLLQKDVGLFAMYEFAYIWKKEQLSGEFTAFEGVDNVEAAMWKWRHIRFVLFRLESNLPDEVCREGAMLLGKYGLSDIAFKYFLATVVEEPDKVLQRLGEVL